MKHRKVPDGSLPWNGKEMKLATANLASRWPLCLTWTTTVDHPRISGALAGTKHRKQKLVNARLAWHPRISGALVGIPGTSLGETELQNK